MKILVCISRVPDTTSTIAFKNNDTVYDDNGVQWIINPYDEWYALVKAIEIKEAFPETVIHLITVGDASQEPVIRKALSLGGDEAVRINKNTQEGFEIASLISTYAKSMVYDLILTGKESIDGNNGMVGSMIAALLDIQSVFAAKKLEYLSNEIIVTGDSGRGEEVMAFSLPLVVSCTKGMAEQRIPNMRGIREARTKSIKVIEPSFLENWVETIAYTLPPIKKSVQLIPSGNEAELVNLLKENRVL